MSQFKIVITSHTELLIKEESSELLGLLEVKRNIADYTRDVKLMPLSDDAAKQFLQSSNSLSHGVSINIADFRMIFNLSHSFLVP